MNSTNQKLNQHLAQSIAKHVDQLGNLIQEIMVESYIQGYNDRAKDDVDNIPKPYVLAYRSKTIGVEFMRGTGGMYYPSESGDLGGVAKSFFLPSEYDIVMVVGQDSVVREIDHKCSVEGIEYTIHSFSELVNGAILVGIGPSMTEYLSESDKKMKVVNIDQLD